MKKLLIGVAATALLSSPVAIPSFSLTSVPAAHAQGAEVSISVFYDRLGDHGSWVSHPRHRYVWVPTDVEAGWVPYSNGKWVYTQQYGWYFASDEPFAWAVYHYGRWAYDTDIGWFWVPGNRWAPAWVSWRRSDDHVGWAPLPPEGDGFAVSIEVSTVEPPRGYWVFVPVNSFVAPNLSTVIVAREEIPVIYQRTEVVGPVVVENNVVVNNVIDVDFIQQHVEQEIEITEVQEVQDPGEAAGAEGVVAFTGEIAVEEEAAPPETVETSEVEAPTEGQEVDSEEPNQGQDAGQTPAEDIEQTEGGEQVSPDQQPSDEAPEGEEQSTEGSPAQDQAPADDQSGDEEQAPSEEQPADEAPADQEPAADEQPADQSPAEEQPSDEAPAEEQPAAEAPADEQPTDEAPAEGQPAEGEQEPAEAAPTEEIPAEQAPAEQAPAEEAPAEGAEEAPAEGQSTGNEACPPEAKQAGSC